VVDVASLVADLGGMAQKRQLVARGARDLDLTNAVKRGEVTRARQGWYTTLPPEDATVRAVRVGGRLTGVSAVAAAGGWVWGRHPLHVSVPRNAARLRSQSNRFVHPGARRLYGVTLHWESPGVAARGTATAVALVDALLRVVLDEDLETAVAALDWALRSRRLDRIEFEQLLLALPANRRFIGDWVDERCGSLPESLSRTRLRLSGHVVRSQVRLGDLQSIDLVVNDCVGFEVDGEEHHRDRFERDREKDLDITISGLYALRPSANAVFRRWPRVLAALQAAIANHSAASSFANSGVSGSRVTRLPEVSGRRRARPRLTPEFPKGAPDAPARAAPTPGCPGAGGPREYPRPSNVASRVSEPIKVDIWSDVQCPWCYIGKRKFEAGAAAAGIPVEVEYHSFELAPDTPVDFEGSPMDYLSQRKGISPDQAEQMLARVTGIAAAVGLDYDYEHVHQTNTVISHELLHFAKSKGRQLEMKERLLEAYFIKGEHVGRIPDLVDIAAELGFDRVEVTEALESHRFLPDVKADMAQAREYGINGVPFFVIDGKYGVSGAQEAETFANVLTQVQTERDVV
jgi:predicted DsbA family dithiol-disulfide isomerase/very-short-patch-repair endonuclease